MNMIFPRQKVTHSVRPWWETSAPSKSSRGKVFIIALLASCLGGFLGVTATGGTIFNSANIVNSSSTIERAPDSVAGIAARVLPSVVSVNTRSATGRGGTGSGFIFDSNGYILTNNHVIAGVANGNGAIRVTLNNGDIYSATIIGRDASYDLAVIKISATNLPALEFGDSDKVAVGDSVIAIGSPLGLSGTVTLGIISAKDRPVTAGDSGSGSSFINALQTDAAINPGNSGGPLVDATGAVIGVNSAIATLGSVSQTGSIGLGFAIPINQTRKTADQLIKSGKATYPFLGVSLDMNYSGVGALVANSGTSILPGGPAAKAGIRAGDLIIKFENKAIDSPEQLIVAIRSMNVGDKVTLTYIRDNKEVTVTVTLVAGNN
jgi:putative serine protease PepD